MEEVDNIIILNLRSIGCDIEDDVQSLKQFSVDQVVDAAARCLKLINHETDLPHSLPPGMSAKFRVGTSLANAVLAIGYRGEIGYQTFLYSNEAEVRRVLMFLIENLPKDSSEAVEETLGSSVLLQRAISSDLSRRLSSPWTPPYCKSNSIVWRGKPASWTREGQKFTHLLRTYPVTSPQGLGDLTKKIPKSLKVYYHKDMPLITKQPTRHEEVSPSILEVNAREVSAAQEWENEWNRDGLASRLSEKEYRAKKKEKLHKKLVAQLRQSVQKAEASNNTTAGQDLIQLINSISDKAGSSTKTKGSRFTHTEKLQFSETQNESKIASQMGVGEPVKVDTEEELQKKREDEVQSLQEELSTITAQLENIDMDIKKFTANTQQMEENIDTQQQKNKEKEDTYKVKKRTMDLLPDAENNIAKLQSVVDASAQKLVNLASQWEKHRAPLIAQYRELKELLENRESLAQKKVEEIKILREKMKTVAEETRTKDSLHKQLVSEYDRMTRDVNRSAYTRRILEIVGNIKKQKEDIGKILIDTRAVQKEINQLTGKLDRTFTVTDELIFKDAKKDESVRKAYKYLAALHENCNLLIRTVEETGVIMREIRDLEDQIDNESDSKVQANLEKISADYQQMKKENASLMAKLKGK